MQQTLDCRWLPPPACAAYVENCGTASPARLSKTIARPPCEHFGCCCCHDCCCCYCSAALPLPFASDCVADILGLSLCFVVVAASFFFWLVAVSVGVGRCQKGMKLEFIAPSTTTPPAAAAATALTVAVAAAASAAEMLNLNSREKASAPPLLQLSLCWLCTVLQPSLLQPALLLLLSSAAFLNFFSVFFGELLQRLRRLFMHNNFNSFRATINVGQQKKSFGSIHAL